MPSRKTIGLVALFLSAACMAHAAEIQLYFSPKGGTQAAIIQRIDAAETEVKVAAYSFTAAPIADALLRAASRGVQVHLVVDKRQPTAHSSQIPRLAAAGLPLRVDRKHHSMHQKVILIDQRYLLAGSYNYSANAENRNAEILLIVDDPDTAAIAATNWAQIYANADPIAENAPRAPPLPKRQPQASPSCDPATQPDSNHAEKCKPLRRVLKAKPLRRALKFLSPRRHRSH